MLPTPHLEKLRAVLDNPKLPVDDRPRVEAAIKRYDEWIHRMTAATESQSAPSELVRALVNELNEYKLYIDIELVFDSRNNFLYRQKGQLKLDNSVLEEFLPWLCNPIVMPEINNRDVYVGPVNAYSGIYFESTISQPMEGGGLRVRTKDQDFAISRPLWIKTSHSADFTNAAEQVTSLAYIAAEIKTNLDKTMFQEATGTARDVKMAISGAKYFLLCDWLDMTPINTRNTPIDEVLILRRAKRIQSNERSSYNTYEGRQRRRSWYLQYLKDNPYSTELFERFAHYVQKLLADDDLEESAVLEQGYF